jgi:phage repressor protein C with HTH and peptisase S24 domain
MSEILKRRITERLEAMGKSARSASLDVSTNADLIRNILVGKTIAPRIDTLEKIAAALDTTPDWLTGRSDEAAAPVTGAPRGSEIRAADVDLPPVRRLPNDVPVRGTAAGSHLAGAFQLETDVVDWVRRPPAMAAARDVYALYVEGSSMEPEHRPGDLRFVHPGRPPRIGDSVVVQTRTGEHDPVQAMIGHLLRQGGEIVAIGKLNPPATVELPRRHVLAIHKVLTMNDLFGM